jgi:hypothetical protein
MLPPAFDCPFHDFCLFCGFTKAQKLKFKMDFKTKSATLRIRFPERNSVVGAKAEAIFSSLYDLDINKEIRGDGGTDFIYYGLHIDVKGTTCVAPQSLQWNYPKHVYVFIQVCLNTDHARFQGFAAGRNWPSLGTFEEFDKVLAQQKLDIEPLEKKYL